MNKRKLKEAEKLFLDSYPRGFQSREMQEISKKHKPEKMRLLAEQSFGEDNFNNVELIVDNMVKIISRSSMVSVFEKPKFRDYAKMISFDEKTVLVKGLYEFLYNNQETGFEMMSDILKMGKLAKWTIMTICPLYFKPQKEVFIKPTTTKGVLKYFEIENLVYNATPSFEFYIQYRNLINSMKDMLDSSLSPDNGAFSGFLMMSIK